MAAIIGSLPRAVGAGRKLSVVQAAITSTGTIATGLTTIDTGGFVVSSANSATSATLDVVSGTSKSGGSVSVAVALLTYSGPTIALDGGAKNVNCIATGA